MQKLNAEDQCKSLVRKVDIEGWYGRLMRKVDAEGWWNKAEKCHMIDKSHDYDIIHLYSYILAEPIHTTIYSLF